MIRLEDFSGQSANVLTLIHSLSSNTVPHACVISGSSGTGKKTLVRLISRAMFCENDRKEPCGHCPACEQIEAGTYRDVITVSPEKPLSQDAKADRKQISIDDIREIIRICGQFSGNDGRAIIIEKAETMTTQAQNTLLKTLEEPPEGTHFFLITEHPENLLSTIISRCTRVHLQPWPDSYIKKLLVSEGISETRADETVLYAGGSIGKARDLAMNEAYWQSRTEVREKAFNIKQRSDIFSTATALKDSKNQFDTFCDMLESLMMSLLYVRLGHMKETTIKDFPDPWINFACNADEKEFDMIFTAIKQCREMRSYNVNIQATVENLLLLLMEEQIKWRKS